MPRHCWFVDVLTPTSSQERLCIWVDDKWYPRAVFPTAPASPHFQQGMEFVTGLWQRTRPPIRIADSGFAGILEKELGLHRLERGAFSNKEIPAIQHAWPFALADWFVRKSRSVRPSMAFWWSMEATSTALSWLEKAGGILPRLVAVAGIGTTRLATVDKQNGGWSITAGPAPENGATLAHWHQCPHARLFVPERSLHDRRGWLLQGTDTTVNAESLLLGMEAIADTAFVRVQARAWSHVLRGLNVETTREARSVVFPDEEKMQAWLSRNLPKKPPGTIHKKPARETG